ncbi:carboxymuconolactone decarboxylase family protein [Edaphobacter modestus]|uniref:Putative peroxidase-related enzyme n=1 Tax=Edaphobacter modestus TaxID=388466 RepID=A0A4Q7YR23_9BACT|nr:carboxymuconolactone decarboxylase family protein [Edaphobacter modestus]RZU39279.1 putative peroxidase-related enzyme [Edaphobacter modestus]
MPRIAPVAASNADAKVASTLAQVKANLGKVPNALATLANAPVALDGYLSLSKALSRGRLTPRQREVLALAIAQANECQYCLSIHTASSKAVGLNPTDTLKARAGNSDDPFERALASFAKKVVQQRGLVSDQGVATAREAGIDDGLMLEVVANVALHTLTNYSNRLVDTEIDFPVVQVNL